jgi:hypothetical protein
MEQDSEILIGPYVISEILVIFQSRRNFVPDVFPYDILPGENLLVDGLEERIVHRHGSDSFRGDNMGASGFAENFPDILKPATRAKKYHFRSWGDSIYGFLRVIAVSSVYDDDGFQGRFQRVHVLSYRVKPVRLFFFGAVVFRLVGIYRYRFPILCFGNNDDEASFVCDIPFGIPPVISYEALIRTLPVSIVIEKILLHVTSFAIEKFIRRYSFDIRKLVDIRNAFEEGVV